MFYHVTHSNFDESADFSWEVGNVGANKEFKGIILFLHGADNCCVAIVESSVSSGISTSMVYLGAVRSFK